MATKKKNEKAEIQVVEIQRGRVEFCIKGITPLICNRLSQKAQRELLFPAPKKNATARASTLKHDPIAEFQASPYTAKSKDSPTHIEGLSSWFHNAMADAALDLEGTNKSQIGRLTWVESDRVSIYGIPELLMATTRQANQQRTPDIRSRVIVPKWACRIAVTFTKPLLNPTAVTNLVVCAGLTQGVGDWRTQKGKGNYGAFEIVAANDPEFVSIMKHGGRASQVAAMENPACYDDETADLLSWFQSEVVSRGRQEELKPSEAVSQNGHAKKTTRRSRKRTAARVRTAV